MHMYVMLAGVNEQAWPCERKEKKNVRICSVIVVTDPTTTTTLLLVLVVQISSVVLISPSAAEDRTGFIKINSRLMGFRDVVLHRT